MTDFNEIRDQLSAKRANGDYTPPSLTITRKPAQGVVDAVNQDGSQMQVTWANGTREVLNAAEVSSAEIS